MKLLRQTCGVFITDGNVQTEWDGLEFALRLEAQGRKVILLTGHPNVPERRPKIVLNKTVDVLVLIDAINKVVR